MSEVVILTQFSRKIDVTFILLVPPNIAGVLVIKIGIFILFPTLTIVFTLFSYSFWVVGCPSGSMIAWNVHLQFGWVEMKLWVVLKWID